MKKNKYNGKHSEECKALDWVELAESLPDEDSGQNRAMNYIHDPDIASERWAIEYDEEENRLVGQSDLENNIVRQTLSEIATEGVLKADGVFVTGEIDAKAVNDGALEKKEQMMRTMEVPVVEVDEFGKETPLVIEEKAIEPKSPRNRRKDAGAGSKKVVIRSEEVPKIYTKNGKLVKVRVKKGESSKDLPKTSKFREESADWKDKKYKQPVRERKPRQAEVSLYDRPDYEDDYDLYERKHYSLVQYFALAMAVVLFISGILTTAVYANYRGEMNKKEAFANLPQFTDGEATVGDAPFAMTEEVIIEDEEQVAEELKDEAEHKTLSLILTSVEKDLKIKLIDDTDSLVKGIVWGVKVTDSDGNESTYQDEDEDGIIHLTDISAGDYTVAIEPSDDLKDYTFPTIGQEVSVKAKVEYKVIANIRDEIKKESEVNVALEDPNGNKPADVETSPPPADTVDWVESTEVEEGDEYEEATVDLSKTEIIVAFSDRILTAARNIAKYSSGLFSRNAVMGLNIIGSRQVADLDEGDMEESKPTEDDILDISDDDTDEADDSDDTLDISDDDADDSDDVDESDLLDNLDDVHSGNDILLAQLDKTELNMKVGDSVSLTLTTFPEDSKASSVSWKSTDTAVATVNDGVVKAVAEGKAKIEVTVNDSITASCTVTVGQGQETSEGFSLFGTARINVGEETVVEAKFAEADDFVFQWESDNNEVVSVNGDGQKATVKAIKPGKVSISATNSSGKKATFLLEIVGEVEYSDDAQLYDSAKNKLYVIENSTYRLAKYSDYKSGKFTKFYRKVGDVLYTGWQTIDGKTYYYTENHEKVTGDQIIGGVPYHFGADGVLAKGSGVLGIDVSKYQPTINWGSVKASGVNYVIVRCGYRGASTGSLIQDPYFTTHIKGAKDAGLKVGVYFFSTALNETEAVEEASMCAALCSGYGINYPVFIDVESSTREGYNALSVEQRTANIRAFCSTIQSAGYTPGLYANKTWLTEKINTASLNCKIWLAQYSAEGPTYTGRYDLWQYTSKGHVDGISGNVDMNQSYLGY